MKSYYVKGLLPEWVIVHEEIEDFELESAFQFQLKWEQTFLRLWQDLIDSERDQITPITPPYTEEMVTGFLDLLKRTRQKRGFFGRVVSALPDLTSDKELPLSISTQEKDIIDQLRSHTHPVFWSSMTAIKPGILQRGGVSVQLTRRFLIGQFQVTQQLWEAVMGNRPSYFKEAAAPVEQVNWLDCVVFCNRLSKLDGLQPVYSLPEGTMAALQKQKDEMDKEVDRLAEMVSCDFDASGYRLPTEAEWEYAARAKSRYRYAGDDDIIHVGWEQEFSQGRSRVVGQKKPNGFGLYDISGNVWEWCWDRYDDYSANDVIDPTGAVIGDYRVLRGGSWFDTKEKAQLDYSHKVRSSDRFYNQGFRLARTM